MANHDSYREMAVGNTFGATALSSYGGFWLAFAIVLTPGGFEIQETLTTADGDETMFYNSFGLFLMVSLSREVVVCSRAVGAND